MKAWRAAVFFLAASVGTCAAADRIPIADFARTPTHIRVELSPDGQSIGYLREFDGRRYMCTQELGSPKITRFIIGTGRAFGTVVPKEV